MARRRVLQGTHLADVPMGDHSEFDKHFQLVINPGMKIVEWRKLFKNQGIRINCSVVWIMIGDSELPLSSEFGAQNQMKKLVKDLVNFCGRKIKKILIGAVLPRPDRGDSVGAGCEVH